MKSFRIQHGDLALNSGKHMDLVTGYDKLIQDLTCWLLEPLGTGFSTPGVGSQLGSMIGSENVQSRLLDVESEVLRVLQLYQSQQFEAIKTARDEGQLYVYSKKEILNVIEDVTATAIGDSIVVNATILTVEEQPLTIGIVISDTGTDIQRVA